jgi:hypothetical protein
VNTPAASILSGAAGALSLNLIHEFTRRTVPHAPRVDIVGMHAVARLARAAGAEPPEHLRNTALAGDLVSNSLYYSLVGVAGRKNAVAAGALAGLAAGVGVLLLPPPLNLGDGEVNRTPATQVMAAGMYLAAGLIAGGVFRALAANADQTRR